MEISLTQAPLKILAREVKKTTGAKQHQKSQEELGLVGRTPKGPYSSQNPF